MGILFKWHAMAAPKVSYLSPNNIHKFGLSSSKAFPISLRISAVKVEIEGSGILSNDVGIILSI